MNLWKIVYTEHAERDLDSIYKYIALSLLNPEIAKEQTQRIMHAASKLNEMPFRFSLYDKEPWHSKGLRVLPVDKYLVFYLTVEPLKTVVIIRIMYSGRDYETQLR
ncbi:type II toxin-antitoxin system RelE/ParE family toxin [Sporolactobacillus sp. STSJ-5]|uniref:type II toxin-antitoxin system RelE/ParE family toxin n=1 Tax=Sporolactobacillus sp. STSJ-5 TaxID=2965076 RepID=UPI0021080014|nr:type II toxin-antitoxin system RelE/ParE family toxin [Sporolactobacillus sp. STSJ-5]MCQ2011365.1 type II toxin-antitoxin system RelE/ParE family toxin [Sporolactobacillus sp. STSJ-5]